MQNNIYNYAIVWAMQYYDGGNDPMRLSNSTEFSSILKGNGMRLNDCSMKHYIVLNMALFSHAHVTISAEIKLTHACSRGDVSHERTAAA